VSSLYERTSKGRPYLNIYLCYKLPMTGLLAITSAGCGSSSRVLHARGREEVFDGPVSRTVELLIYEESLDRRCTCTCTYDRQCTLKREFGLSTSGLKDGIPRLVGRTVLRTFRCRSWHPIKALTSSEGCSPSTSASL
jgi:hypothetical protein